MIPSTLVQELRRQLTSMEAPSIVSAIHIGFTKYDKLHVQCRILGDKVAECERFVRKCVEDYLRKTKWWKLPSYSVETGLYMNNRHITVKEEE